MGIPEKLQNRLNKNKLNTIQDNKFYKEEVELFKNDNIVDYYLYILDIDIDKNNIQNSYIMWAANKVDKLDINSPCKITKGKISLPDIDVDIPSSKRDLIIDYIKNKYGEDKVAQIITYQCLQGRQAIKMVFRAYGGVSFDEMNKITQCIPDKAKVADELQEMLEEEGESSLIKYTLENDTKGELSDWAVYNAETKKIEGKYAKYFEQAIRLEGTKIAQSKHAAGIIIGNSPLHTVSPMVYDKRSHAMLVGIEYNDGEAIGLVKFDLLGLSLLTKLMGIQQILRYGDIIDDN